MPHQNRRVGIVGQGLAGTALAWQAHWRGYAVQIFDQGHTESASWVAAGLINPLVLKRKRLVKNAQAHCLSMERFYAKVEVELDTELFYPGPIHEILSDHEEDNAWHGLASEQGFDPFIGPSKPLSHPELKGFRMGEVNGSRRLRVQAYLTESRRFFSQHHQVVEESVCQIEAQANAFVVNGQTVDILLLAEGLQAHWTTSFFGAPDFAPTRGEGLRISWQGEPLHDAVHKNVFLLPDGDGTYQVGSTYAWEGFDLPPQQAAREEICTKLRTWFNASFLVEDQWVGIRPTMKDRQPILGWHQEYSRLGYLNGLGSRGALLSPLLSAQLFEAASLS
ncbi:MAG TPA: hypothetical protein DCE13_02145 [Cryomorphaceae bacterium]|jgi:glycine oxidase|nr:MAG: hypothetical protein ABR98_07255 [Cryomorphaceae bacterium BACL7 MAG-120910-bin2]KRO68898.1 MAG: hypothetical protein ABR88_01140 [Cryomorphaceae bacterium BACL7 MAG-120322-bin74]KRO84048.1 MAG: hypothetical protein ABR87_05775 [Cryomorphaceae bacterium BACL7 MAG-121220-bin83]NQW25698.1 FAD-binding oxidoreductase [Cryomorphaceae bacterium]HAB31322.1 hypothetical protein [Cryomorphaceae bacterium]